MIRSPALFLRLLMLVSGILMLVMASAFLLGGSWQGASEGLAQQPEPTADLRPLSQRGTSEQFFLGFLRLGMTAQPTPTPAPKATAIPEPEPEHEHEPAAAPVEAPPSAPQQPQAPVAPPPAAQPSCPTAGMSGYALALFDAINAERAAAGMAGLAANGCVTYVAQIRSNDMASRGYFAHASPEGQTAFSLLDYYGIPFGWAGENLARNNYPNDQTVGIAIRDLMASPGHRANILSPNYTQMGVAVAIDGAGMKYFTMVFIGPA